MSARPSVRRFTADAAENALAERVRSEALRCLRRARVRSDLAEDITQDLCLDVVPRVAAGEVAAGAIDAYVRRAAINRARDAFRREKSGVFRSARCADVDADELVSTDAHAEAMLVRSEEEGEVNARIAQLRAVLAQAPERYRVVLAAVYFDRVPIDELVLREVGSTAYGPSDIKRTRNRIDKHLERARKWVRSRMIESHRMLVDGTCGARRA